MDAGWKFVVFETYSGLYQWRLEDAHGRAVAVSTPGFETPGQARRAAETVQANAGWAEVHHQLPSQRGVRALTAATRRRLEPR